MKFKMPIVLFFLTLCLCLSCTTESATIVEPEEIAEMENEEMNDEGENENMNEDNEDTNEDESEDENDDENSTNQSITASVNGMPFNSTVQGLITATLVDETGFYGLVLLGNERVSESEIRSISVGLFGADFSTVQEGTAFTNVIDDDITDGATGVFGRGMSIGEIETTETVEIFVQITAIDRTNRTISGVFNFVAIDSDNDTTYTITEGVFTDIIYQLP